MRRKGSLALLAIAVAGAFSLLAVTTMHGSALERPQGGRQGPRVSDEAMDRTSYMDDVFSAP